MKVFNGALFLFAIAGCQHVFSQTRFQKTIGGTVMESLWDMQSTIDSGYISIGHCTSLWPGGIFLVKTNGNGDTIWTGVYGGGQGEDGIGVMQTDDGGYLATGDTYSFGAGGSDGFVLKTDAMGNLQWSKTYGGAQTDELIKTVPGWSGGYLLAGVSFSFSTSQSDIDVYLVRTDVNGDTLWTRAIGTSGQDNTWDLCRTPDSCYLITGYTDGTGAGQADVFLMKVGDNGNLLWAKTYGGAGADAAISMIALTAGGYLLAGSSQSFGAFSNDGDLFLIRTDENGDTLWCRTHGGAGTDVGRSVQQTSGNGFIIAGETFSFGPSLNNVYLVKADSAGDHEWSMAYGSNGVESARSVRLATDGGYMIGALSGGFGAGNIDFYFIKTDAVGNSNCNQFGTTTLSTRPSPQVMNAPFTVRTTGTVVTTPSPYTLRGGMMQVLCSNVGTEDLNTGNELLVFPNPFFSEVLIQCGTDLRNATVIMYNMLGVEVQKHRQVSGREVRMARGDLTAGMYYFNITGQGELIGSGKLMIVD